MMAILPIVKEGDPVLRQVAKKVPKITKRILKLLNDMEDTLYAADGVGLAAPQVGVSERLVVIDVGDGPMHMINPEIVSREGREVDTEGCLSIPGIYGYVERAAKVTVVWTDERGKSRRTEATGLLARAFQHEIDHLDGVLFTDKATGIGKESDEISEKSDQKSR